MGGKSAGRERQISAKAAARFAGGMAAFSQCRWEPCRCTGRDSDGETRQPFEVLKGAKSSCGEKQKSPYALYKHLMFLKGYKCQEGSEVGCL